MAAPKTRVTRNGNGGDDTGFVTSGEDELNLGPDVALVGDPGDGANIIAEDDPKEANWDLPDGGTSTNKGRQTRETATDVDPEFDEEDSRVAYTESGDPDADTPQSRSRRTRRNERRRVAQAQAQQETETLRRQVEQLTGVVTRLASGQQGLAVNTLDAQMSTLQGQLRVVDDEMANAIKTSDGDTYQRAQRLRDEIVGRLYAVQAHRKQMATEPEPDARTMQNGGVVQNGNAQVRQPQAPDPRVTDYFDKFCDRYEWFDPASPDANANIVRAVDQELVTQGYQRNTPVFWQQLERKLANEYGLKPGAAAPQEDEDDQEDERPGRREVTRRTQQRPPTNGGRSTSSGRGAGFRLSDVQTNILREEGLLEENLTDADKAKRQRIVDKWKRGATADRRGAAQ